jgi:hypothetical protein
MAEDQKTFPMLPIGHWWLLRKKFKQSIPGIVTDGYLSTVLDMQPNSARANVLPYLRQLRIIDDEGKPTERATLWRDDEHYPQVCKAILDEVYPNELLHAVPDPNTDRARTERWFAHKTRAGEAAVRRMAALYAVLAEADAAKQPDNEKKQPAAARPVRARRVTAAVPAAVRAPANPPSVPQPQPLVAPGININLQVHISADATPDQIDQIFASMAKHIYQRG